MSVFATGEQPKSMYHEVDTRYNLSELPLELDQDTRIKIKQQAQSIACLVEKSQLIETTKDGVTQYRISSRVLTLAEKLQVEYEAGYKAHCAQQNRTYREEDAKASYI